jgi:hypothetical protein
VRGPYFPADRSSGGSVTRSGRGPVRPHYTGHIGGGLRNVPIYHHGVGDGPSLHLFELAGPEAFGDVGFVVASGPEACLLGLGRGRQEQDQGGVRAEPADLLGPLEVDLEEDVVTVRGIRDRGAVEVPEELGPLEEPTGPDPVLEGGSVDEVVGIVTLARPADPRGPRPAEPERLIARYQPIGDCALPGPSGPDGRPTGKRVASGRSRAAAIRAGCCPDPAAAGSR